MNQSSVTQMKSMKYSGCCHYKRFNIQIEKPIGNLIHHSVDGNYHNSEAQFNVQVPREMNNTVFVIGFF